MIPEPVDLHRVRGALQAVVEARRIAPEAAWESFREWCGRHGRVVPESFEQPPLQYHQLQDLYAFGLESAPRAGFLRLAGRAIAAGLWRDQLPEFLSASLADAASVPEVAEGLFRRFMAGYSIATYGYRASHTRGGLSIALEYADAEAMGRYLRSHGLDPAESFRRSFQVVAATVEAVLERFVEPWDARRLQSDPESGRLEVRFPAGAGFNFHGIIGTLAERTRTLESRAAERLRARGLEQDLILRSATMREAWEKIRRAGPSEELILLRGEPGTGKTHLAERIHEMSARAGGPFVEVALTSDAGSEGLIQSQLFGHARGAFTGAVEAREGLFAQAHGGTIFLDEIGDAGPDLQAKLLRVIEKKTFRPLGAARDVSVDVRILAATNRDLDDLVRGGAFRADLYHRLNVIQVELPPLRERAGDVAILCDHFLGRLALELRRPPRPLSPESRKVLEGYSWPGNIRELIHALKHALLFSKGAVIRPRDFPERIRSVPGKEAGQPARKSPASPRGRVVDTAELERLLAGADVVPVEDGRTWEIPWHIDHARRAYLEALIRHCRGNVRKMAAYWDRSSPFTLRALLKRFGLWEAVLRARNSDK